MFATLIFLWIVALIGFSIAGKFHEFISVFRDAGIWIYNGHLVFGIVMALLLWPWCLLVDRGNQAGESYRDAAGKVIGHQYEKDGPRRKTGRIGAWVLFIFMGVYALVSIYPNEVVKNRPDWIDDIKSIRDPINLLVVGADSSGVINQDAVRSLEQSQNQFFAANWRYMVLSLCFLGLIFVIEGMLSTKAKRGTVRIISVLAFLTIIGLTWPGGMSLKELFLASWQWVVTSLCLIGLVISFKNMMGDKPKRIIGRIVTVLVLVTIVLVTWSGEISFQKATPTPLTTSHVGVVTSASTDTTHFDRALNSIKKSPQWWRYLVTTSYILSLLGVIAYCLLKRKFRVAGIVLVSGLALGTIFRVYFLPHHILAMSSGFGALIFGVIDVAHGLWCHRKLNRPVSWNIDPEAEPDQQGPQVNYYGLWGSMMFHSFMFLLFGPFAGFMHLWKFPIYVSLLFSLPLAALVIYKLGKWPSWDKIKEKALPLVVRFWAWFQSLAYEEVRIQLETPESGDGGDTLPMVHGDENRGDDLLPQTEMQKTFGGRLRQFAVVGGIIFGLILVMWLLTIKTSSLLSIAILVPISVLVAGTYEVHIRGMLLPAFGKYIIYSRFWLLGAEYLVNGVWVTLLPAFLPRLKMIQIPHHRWELDSIETPEIPTRDLTVEKLEDKSKAEGSVLVKIVAKAVLQVFNPRYYMKMPAEDRATLEATKAVLLRTYQDILRDVTKNLTYNQVRLQDYFQFSVRRQDLGEYPVGHPLVAKYHQWCIMEVKVRKVNTWATFNFKDPVTGEERTLNIPVDYDPHFVDQDEKGVLIPATCQEYCDWKTETAAGVRAIELGIMDISAPNVEAAEQDIEIERRKVKKAQMTKLMLKELGEGEGDRRAAEVSRFLDMLVTWSKDADDPDIADLAMKRLVDMIGAEKLGTIFKTVQGAGDLLDLLSNKAKAGSKN